MRTHAHMQRLIMHNHLIIHTRTCTRTDLHTRTQAHHTCDTERNIAIFFERKKNNESRPTDDYVQLTHTLRDAPRLRTNALRDCGRMCSATADVACAATRPCTSLMRLTVDDLCPATADDNCNGLRVMPVCIPATTRDCGRQLQHTMAKCASGRACGHAVLLLWLWRPNLPAAAKPLHCFSSVGERRLARDWISQSIQLSGNSQ